ncbi:tyrosine phosphatase [Apiospora arundinis]
MSPSACAQRGVRHDLCFGFGHVNRVVDGVEVSNVLDFVEEEQGAGDHDLNESRWKGVVVRAFDADERLPHVSA